MKREKTNKARDQKGGKRAKKSGGRGKRVKEGVK